ncbi:MAG: DUF2382 domain-containing protein [Synechococcales cyanobacterium M58_A2018_015]|nr:DUF2382 domain-containing protein [Synechococcales cyanobacterium M58_A2018_015]
MALHKIRDFYPDYRDQFGDHDILSYSLYAGAGDDKVGSVDDLLVDEDGRFRYLVINTGAWIFGKKVLLPIGRARIDYNNKRVYVDGLTREQVENLPEYNSDMTMDYDYEERVRGVYRRESNPAMMQSTTTVDPTPASASMAAGSGAVSDRTFDYQAGAYDRDSYRYDYDADLYNFNDRDQTLKLYEERLVAGSSRRKAGEVTVGKRVETETQHVSVPIEKERVVVERVNPSSSEVSATVGTDAFNEGEVVRMEVYEETPEIRKEAFVREEVRVRKEVDREVVEADETIRREQLDINKEGNPNIRD